MYYLPKIKLPKKKKISCTKDRTVTPYNDGGDEREARKVCDRRKRTVDQGKVSPIEPGQVVGDGGLSLNTWTAMRQNKLPTNVYEILK